MSEHIIWESDKTETIDYLGVKHGISHFEKREEIVRCRDCKHLVAHGAGCSYWDFCDVYDTNGFCAWGERRDA